MKYDSIAIFCGSAEGHNPAYIREAAAFGKMCANRHITLYSGGGCIGLMKAAGDAVLAHDGEVIGVAPKFFSQTVIRKEGLTKLIEVSSMSERKQYLERTADAFVIFPGGYGTMDEFFEILTDAQLGMHNKPIILYNLNGFYDALAAQLKHFHDEGFLRPFHYNLLIVATSLQELFDGLDNYVSSNDNNWLQTIKQ